MKKNQIGRIMSYIKPYGFLTAVSFVSAAVSACIGLLIPIFSGRAIDGMIGKGKVDFAVVAKYGIYIAVAAGIGAVLQQVMAMCNNKITYGIAKRLRNEATEKIHRLPLSYLDSHPSGDILSRIITDIDTFSDGMLMGFSQLFTGVITIVGTLSVMFFYNTPITVIVFVLTPLSLFVASFISKKTRRYFTEQAQVRGEETALINEIIDGQKVIYAFSHERKALEEFGDVNDRLKKASFSATFYSSLANPSTRLVNNIVYAGVTLASALFSVGGGITIGQLSVFLSYASQYAKPFNEISGVITELQNAFASVGRVFELLDETEETPDSEDARTLENAGSVSLRNVSFGYTPEKILLKNITLDVKRGQRVAIVGPTGCGKTTLINLLMRFYHVGGGEICVEGINIENVTKDSLRRSYGMVLQDTWLKNATVKENIAYGNPAATDEEIINAAKAAYADSFIRRLPNGYDTVINENGDGISLGQKQLLCIARAMLCLPPMLILDEATSSIDTRTEIKIQSAFSDMMNGRTSFIVAHRLSTIRGADIILVMKDGNIIEKGTHDELLEKNGFYAELYNSQFSAA